MKTIRTPLNGSATSSPPGIYPQAPSETLSSRKSRRNLSKRTVMPWET
jgi:hypothetical protein